MRRPRILVVDDDLAIIKLIRASLKNEGWDILTAMGGAEGLYVNKCETVPSQPGLVANILIRKLSMLR